MKIDTLILGGGLSGLSASYHRGHHKCLILEESRQPCGHIRSLSSNGYTFDQGPHVSFTKDVYVRQLFAESVDGAFEEYPVRTRNYYKGHWIDHPAQSNFYQIPPDLRAQCLASFKLARSEPPSSKNFHSYREWINYAFGPIFADTFVAPYTRKYWTVEPEELGVDWIGKRVFYPKSEEVLQGAVGPLPQQTHYITHVRYPTRGGYQSFARKLLDGANVQCGSSVRRIDLDKKCAWVGTPATGGTSEITYDHLISTIPLPVFLALVENDLSDARAAADELACSELVLIDIMAAHPTQIEGNWFYIYDEDMLSTRIHCTEVLSPSNAPVEHSGIQVEVYAHPKKGFSDNPDEMAARVTSECRKMGFLTGNTPPIVRCRHIPYANIICDHSRRRALDVILTALELFGLEREADDLDAFTDWENLSSSQRGNLVLCGRFAQWKYFWSDDCVLRGRAVSP